MTHDPVPAAAVADMKAAIEDYRRITPPTGTTAAGLAELVATRLISLGWEVRPAPSPLGDLTDEDLQAWVDADADDPPTGHTGSTELPGRINVGR